MKSSSGNKDFSNMGEAELEELWKRLQYYAFRNYGWMSRDNLDELIEDAIGDVLLGIRKWPPLDEQGREKSVSLFVFLCQTLRSKLNHSFERQRKIVYIDLSDLENQLSQHMPRFTVEESDQIIVFNDIMTYLLDNSQEDQVVTDMLSLLKNEPDLKPVDIAEMLGLPVEEIYNAKKRIRNLARSLNQGKG